MEDWAKMGEEISRIMWGTKTKKKKKRVKLTPKQRIFIWEHPKICGRTCSICHQRITKLSDLEVDHTKAFSKGGKKLALAHRDCNRMKASGSLIKIQRTLGIKTKKPKKKGRTKKRKRKAQPRRLPKTARGLERKNLTRDGRKSISKHYFPSLREKKRKKR